jgi:alpha-glucosidase
MLQPKHLVEGFNRYDDVYQDIRPDTIKTWAITEDKIRFTSNNNVTLEVTAIGYGTFRFRYSATGQFEPDFSYALADFPRETIEFIPWEADLQAVFNSYPLLDPDAVVGYCMVKEWDDKIALVSPNGYEVWIDKMTLAATTVCNYQGEYEVLCEQSSGYSVRQTILNGTENVQIQQKIQVNERFLGLGDKSCSLNLRGKKFENWCTDSFGYDENSDPLYRAIPFFYGVVPNKETEHSLIKPYDFYGIFMDNTFRSHFDFGTTEADTLTYSADGGEMNYYLFFGAETLNDILKSYLELTGVPEQPPMWALGFHQCRWSYYPEARVRAIAKQFRELKIPCDAIYLDIDYMDGYRCFTWNDTLFPNPKQMIADLKSDGFETVVMIDPGIKVEENYSIYKEGVEKDFFCRRSNGELMLGPVWPDTCAFPEFTNPKVRDWFGSLYEDLYTNLGVSGFWNDMNEPAVFHVKRMTFPDEVRHDYDGHPTNHAKAHNVYGMLMTRSTKEGLERMQPEKRPYLLCRASYSGGQRYAAVWTGDNLATWAHLKIANLQCQRLGISGFALNGTDIGGFAENPTAELFTRWMQLAVFHPVMRVHSAGNHEDGASIVDDDQLKAAEAALRQDQEPWVFGEPYTATVRAAIELRYRLLPYFYTTFAFQRFSAMVKSLSFYEFLDEQCFEQEDQFLFGSHIVVAPILEEGQTKKSIYLPQTDPLFEKEEGEINADWFDFATGLAYEGGTTITLDVTLASIPMFVRAGACLPLYPIRQHTKERVEQLTWHIYYDAWETSGVYFDDAGDGYGENYREKLDGYMDDENTFVLNQSIHPESDYTPQYSSVAFLFFGLPSKPKSITSMDKKLKVELVKGYKVPVYKVVVDKVWYEVRVHCQV